MRMSRQMISLLCLAGVPTSFGQNLPSLSVADLSQRLAEAEARLQDVDVLMTVTHQVGAISGLAPGTYVNTVRWVFRAPFGSRFRLEQEGMKPWDRGARDTLAMAGTLTFDGVDSWSLFQYGSTLEEVQVAAPAGTILSGEHTGVDLGEGYRGLTFWRHRKPLSEVIQSISGTAVEVADLEDFGAVYRVDIPWNGKKGDEGIAPERVFLDPTRGFAIICVEQPTGDPAVLNSLLRVTELTPAAPNVWMPTNAVCEWRGRNGTLASSYHWQVHAVSVNTNPGDELFTIDFPAGTMVSDTRTGVGFKVGFGADGTDEAIEDQASAAQAAVAQLAAGTQVELPVLGLENVSVPPFPTKLPGERESFPRWLIGMALGLGVAVASVIGFAAIRVRKTRPVLFCALLTISVMGVLLAGASTYALADSLSTGSSTRPATSRAVFDCGRSVLGVLAKYYDTGWNAEDVIEHTGTTPGMSLLEVRDTARAMGLDAEGVRVGTSGQLGELLSEPRSAVVVATSLGPREQRIGHFLCTVGATTGHFIVIDPPRPVHLMKVEDMGEAIVRGEGYALVIRPKG